MTHRSREAADPRRGTMSGRGPVGETWLAPAKINLWLRITGRRDDGYHTLDTCYQAIDLHDTVTLEPLDPEAGEPRVTCSVKGEMASGVPEGEGNLAVRAARLLAARIGHELNLSLTITKAIPAGAGLGGGSSDAAAVLLALARRFAVPDPARTLRELALELGADVPFFLEGGTQRAAGIGESLTPVSRPPERSGILVYPGVPVSTAWAYRVYDETAAGRGLIPTTSEKSKTDHAASVAFMPSDWRSRGNDFEAVLFSHRPEIASALEVLAKGPTAFTRMSGSGSAVFALYTDPSTRDGDLARVQEALREAPGVRVGPFACVGRGVRPVVEAATGNPSSYRVDGR